MTISQDSSTLRLGEKTKFFSLGRFQFALCARKDLPFGSNTQFVMFIIRSRSLRYILTGVDWLLVSNKMTPEEKVWWPFIQRDNCNFKPHELFLATETTCRAEMKWLARRFVLFLNQFAREWRECKLAADRLGMVYYPSQTSVDKCFFSARFRDRWF